MEFHKGFMAHIDSWCQVLIFLSVSLCSSMLELLVESRMRESPQTLWILGICEVRLGTFLPTPWKNFVARDGILNLLYSDPGILKPAERFTGWKQITAVDSLFVLKEHPASSWVTKVHTLKWMCAILAHGWQTRAASAKNAHKNLNLSAGSHSALIIKKMNL